MAGILGALITAATAAAAANAAKNQNKNNSSSTSSSASKVPYRPSNTTSSSSGSTSGNNAWKTGVDDYGDTDYSVLLNNAMKAGASASEVQSLLDQRTQKALDKGYSQYAYDDVYSSAQNYIKNQQQAQAQQNVNDYSDYIEEMNRAQQEAALADLRAAYESNLSGINRTQQSISPTYQAARNQAAGNAALQQQSFNEYAAASGLNSGAGGQAQLAMQNQLQSNLSDLNTTEASTLADLELQRNQAEIDYNNAIAQAQAQGDYQLASQLYQEKVRVDEAMRDQILQQAQMDFNNAQFQWQQGQQNWSNQFAQQQYEDTADQQEWARLYELAQQMAQYGDFSGYEALGIDTTQMEETYRQQLAAASSRGSGSSDSGSSMSLSTAEDMANAGQFTDDVLNAFYKNGYTDDYLSFVYGYNPGGSDTGKDYVPNITQPQTISTYDQAVSYLQQNGLNAGGLMTSSEFARHKNNGAYDQSGASYFATYSDYLNAFIQKAYEDSLNR